MNTRASLLHFAKTIVSYGTQILTVNVTTKFVYQVLQTIIDKFIFMSFYIITSSILMSYYLPINSKIR